MLSDSRPRLPKHPTTNFASSRKTGNVAVLHTPSILACGDSSDLGAPRLALGWGMGCITTVMRAVGLGRMRGEKAGFLRAKNHRWFFKYESVNCEHAVVKAGSVKRDLSQLVLGLHSGTYLPTCLPAHLPSLVICTAKIVMTSLPAEARLFIWLNSHCKGHHCTQIELTETPINIHCRTN